MVFFVWTPTLAKAKSFARRVHSSTARRFNSWTIKSSKHVTTVSSTTSATNNTTTTTKNNKNKNHSKNNNNNNKAWCAFASTAFSNKCLNLTAIINSIPKSKKQQIEQQIVAKTTKQLIQTTPGPSKYIYVLKCGTDDAHPDTKWLVGEMKGWRFPPRLSPTALDWLQGCDRLVLQYLLPKTDYVTPSEITKDLMVAKGVHRVRGGRTMQANLTKQQLRSLAREFCAKYEICVYCHQSGHVPAICAKAKSRSQPNQAQA